jgi:hypothetical protein
LHSEPQHIAHFRQLVPAENTIATNTKTFAAQLEIICGDRKVVAYTLSNLASHQ